MQVPPQLSAFQMLLGNTDGSTQLPHDVRAELDELSDSLDVSATTSFVSIITPLLESHQPTTTYADAPTTDAPATEAPSTDALNANLVSSAVVESDPAHPSSPDVGTVTRLSNATSLPAENDVHSQSNVPPSINASGEGDRMHDAPQLADPARAYSTEAPSIEPYRSDVLAESSALGSHVATKTTAGDTPTTQPDLPARNTLLSQPQRHFTLNNTAEATLAQSQPIDRFIAAAVAEVHDVEPAVARLLVTRQTNTGQVVEQPQASVDPAIAPPDRHPTSEQVADVNAEGIDRRLVSRRDQAGQPLRQGTDIEPASSVETNRVPKPAAPASLHASSNQPAETTDATSSAGTQRTEGTITPRGHSPIAEVATGTVPNAESQTNSNALTHDLGDLQATVVDAVPTPGSSPSATTMQSTQALSSNALTGGATASPAVEIAAQIVEAVHLETAIESQRSPRLEVQLDPPELGKVWIELSEARDGVMAKITVSRADTHQLLEGELAQIRSSLDEAGVQVSDFQVGHDQSRFEDDSKTSMRTSLNEVGDDVPEVDANQVTRYGPQGSRIDVRL